MFCINCGNQLSQGAVFCNNCGAKAGTAAGAGATTAAAPTRDHMTRLIHIGLQNKRILYGILAVLLLFVAVLAISQLGSRTEVQGTWAAGTTTITFSGNRYTVTWYEDHHVSTGWYPIEVGSTVSLRGTYPFGIGPRVPSGTALTAVRANFFGDTRVRYEASGTFSIIDGRIEFLCSDSEGIGIADYQTTANTLELNGRLLQRQ